MNKTFLIILSFGLCIPSYATDYYLDSRRGDDSKSGKSKVAAWRSLEKANAADFKPGDRLLLKCGSRFAGGLKLKLKGEAGNPIIIESYGEGPVPFIDAKGYLAGIQLIGSHHVVVKDLEITADGGKTTDGSNAGLRFGVFVQGKYGSTSHITLENLTINKIYP
jgi:hypothetical protein